MPSAASPSTVGRMIRSSTFSSMLCRQTEQEIHYPYHRCSALCRLRRCVCSLCFGQNLVVFPSVRTNTEHSIPLRNSSITTVAEALPNIPLSIFSILPWLLPRWEESVRLFRRKDRRLSVRMELPMFPERLILLPDLRQ